MFLSYCRVSTDEQHEGTSPEDQEKKTRAIIALKTTDPDEIRHYYDAGVSGSTPIAERPEGARMLTEAQRGDTIVATKLDRLFRSANDALATAKRLKSAGVELIVIDLGIEPVASSGAGKMFFSMLAVMAEFERDRMLERVVAGRTSKRLHGGYVGGDAPYGFKKIGGGRAGRLDVDREERDVIVYAQHLRNGGYSTYAIAGIFTELGISSRNGKPFVRFQLDRMLANVRYYGRQEDRDEFFQQFNSGAEGHDQPS